MGIEANKALVCQFYDAVNRQDFGALDALVHKDFVFYMQIDQPRPGIQGFVDSEKASFAAFETVRFPVEHLVAEGDKVAAYLVFDGKNQICDLGDNRGRGRNLKLSVFCLLTIRDGKIVEKRAHYDTGDARRQLTAN